MTAWIRLTTRDVTNRLSLNEEWERREFRWFARPLCWLRWPIAMWRQRLAERD